VALNACFDRLKPLLPRVPSPNLYLTHYRSGIGPGKSRSFSSKLVYNAAMKLEDYFDYLAPDDIRLKGTRVGIESVLYEYVHRQQAAEAIAQRFPTLTLDQVYASILYYLRNRPQMDAYLADWLEWSYRVREEQRQNPPPFAAQLAALKEEREKYRTAES
jgi:uncharacterized protein (DUF433 family)